LRSHLGRTAYLKRLAALRHELDKLERRVDYQSREVNDLNEELVRLRREKQSLLDQRDHLNRVHGEFAT
jgi:predicted  nucleic acid-binding Zn-ribbon protein